MLMKRIVSRLPYLLVAGVVAVHLLLAGAPVAHAQFFDESLEGQDVFIEDEDQYFEEGLGQGEMGPGGVGTEPDYTEGHRFVDESLIPPSQRGLTVGARQLQLTLGQERETLPLNVAWGAGTGLLIGGWYALIAEGDNRDTQRSIGVGIVAGIILGIAVGTRSLFNPDAPRPATSMNAPPPTSDGPNFVPTVAFKPGAPEVGFRMTF